MGNTVTCVVVAVWLAGVVIVVAVVVVTSIVVGSNVVVVVLVVVELVVPHPHVLGQKRRTASPRNSLKQNVRTSSHFVILKPASSSAASIMPSGSSMQTSVREVVAVILFVVGT